ncbi:MAG TPA: hypothetical protein VFE50_22475 [Cyclobacteriaceae bacterium]|nr:hypothetical protein [Cyclobacteriaceae bacterium]
MAQSLWINGGANVVPIFHDPSGGFYVGIAKDLSARNNFIFRPALLYSWYSYSYRNLYGSISRYSIHNIQLPMSFRFDVGKWGGVGFGPQFSVIPNATGKYRQDPSRAITSSMPVVNLSAFVGPYFRVSPRLTIEVRAMLDAQVFDRIRWEWQYLVIQSGVSWLITKPAEG